MQDLRGKASHRSTIVKSYGDTAHASRCFHSIERIHVEFFPVNPTAKCCLKPPNFFAYGFWRSFVIEEAVAFVTFHFNRAQRINRPMAELRKKAFHLATRLARSRGMFGRVPVQVPI
ncbi:hypothetical protein [Xanthomonas arboricola]|uniref:hypothetical protein n=1 Tax=Xanthomonas arboricola TaxID=56448 RepID=UPI001CED2478